MLGNVVKWKCKGSQNIWLFQCVPVSLFSLRQRQQADSGLATTEKMLYEIIIIEKIKPSNINIQEMKMQCSHVWGRLS